MVQPACRSDRDLSPNELKERLEDFVFDNPELERLEAILDTFNPFVAMGWTRQELRHSAFLAWLLNPSETHRLGSYFLSVFLKRIAKKAPPGSPSVVDIDGWDLSGALVHQEWRNLDLLIQDDQHRLVVAIENKVDSREHSDQLRRYHDDVLKHFPRYRKLFAYLTPGGEEPSMSEYSPMGYSEVVAIVETAITRRGEQLSDDVRSFLRHYSEMLRRYIVADSEIEELCRTIYERHRKALDVLFDQRPDRASDVASWLGAIVASRPELVPDHSTKSWIRFIPKALDVLPLVGEGWTASKRMVLFQLYNAGEEVGLTIALGPGDQSVRDRIYKTIRDQPTVFNRASQKLYPQWWTFHAEKWIAKKRYSETTPEELKAELEQHLDKFVSQQLRPMEVVFTLLAGQFVER